MNACGRLADANNMIELLTTNDVSRARILAAQIEGLNAQRKLLTDQVFQAALSQIGKQPKLLESPVIVLSHASWPAGVIGIVASRLVELYHRPVILFSNQPGADARGSARSIEGINITKAISLQHHLLETFGGHPMAAGFSINPLNIPQFQKEINKAVKKLGVEIIKEKELQVDTYVSLAELNIPLVADLERLAPFGPGNPPIVLATRNLSLTGYSIWWQAAGFPLPEGRFDLAFSVRASTYHGQKGVQIEWIDYRLPDSSSLSINAVPEIKVIDFRHHPKQVDQLNQIHELSSCIIWGEGIAINSVECLDRHHLHPSEVLVIWTIPPGIHELQFAIHATKPSKVYLFGNDPGLDDPGSFLKRLLGLLKYCIKNSNGKTRLSSLAAGTSQKISTVKLGLSWLEVHGHICIIKLTEDLLLVEIGNRNIIGDTESISNQLNTALNETAAFRRYFLRADKNRLLLYEDAMDS
jgi:single-stranded-DNA-specific exonuclease